MRKGRRIVRAGRRPVIRVPAILASRRGMEMVQVGILIAIAVAVGLIFKTEITDFVNGTFEGLSSF